VVISEKETNSQKIHSGPDSHAMLGNINLGFLVKSTETLIGRVNIIKNLAHGVKN